VPVSPSTHRKLKACGRKDETFDALILRLIEESTVKGVAISEDEIQIPLVISENMLKELEFRLNPGAKVADAIVSVVADWLRSHPFHKTKVSTTLTKRVNFGFGNHEVPADEDEEKE